MCGPSGAGKSTYADLLEEQGMVRLSADVELFARGVTDVPPPETVRAEVHGQLKQRLLALVAEGRDVVLDLSFWSRAMRDEWRSLLAPTGVVPETIYLATDKATILARLRERRGAHAHDFVLDEALAERYVDHFEVPTPVEGPLTVVTPGAVNREAM
jgi:predicted kinase